MIKASALKASKKARPRKPASIFTTAHQLERAVGFLDVTRRERDQLERNLRSSDHNLESERRRLREIETNITYWEDQVATQREKLEAMPISGMTKEDVVKLLEQVAKLPWVYQVKLNDSGFLEIKTRVGVLKTTFKERRVYHDYNGIQETLEEPLALPLPQYRIGINLSLLAGGEWPRDTQYMWISLVRSIDTNTSPPETSAFIANPRPHWSTPGGRRVNHICVGDYGRDFAAAGKLGLLPFLDMLAIFLQNAGGDSGAYCTQFNWAMWLGNKNYYEKLLRPLDVEGGETFETVKAGNRATQKKINARLRAQEPEEIAVPTINADALVPASLRGFAVSYDRRIVNRGAILGQAVSAIRAGDVVVQGTDGIGPEPLEDTSRLSDFDRMIIDELSADF